MRFSSWQTKKACTFFRNVAGGGSVSAAAASGLGAATAAWIEKTTGSRPKEAEATRPAKTTLFQAAL